MKPHQIISITIAIFLCSACVSERSTPTPDLDATLEVALEQTIAAQPTYTETAEPTQTPAATNTPTLLPTAIVTEEVKSFTVEALGDGWARYTYQELGFLISLPPNWAHLDLTADDLGEILSYANENNQQLGDVYSSTYLRDSAAAGIKFMAVDSSVASLSAGIPTSINILIADLPFDISLDDYVEINIQQIRNMMGENMLIQQERMEISNTEAEKISYEAVMNDVFGNPHLMALNQYLILVGRTQYVITLGTLREFSDVNQTIFFNILQSFEFVR